MDFCPIMNDMWFQMDTFKYLFWLNGQKSVNIQNICGKRIQYVFWGYFVGCYCNSACYVNDASTRFLLCGFG